MQNFKAYRIFNEDGKVSSRFVDTNIEELSAGEVIIKAAYSSVNYKDALAATGAGKIIRRFPCVGGIDVSGVVESSSDSRYKKGDEVLVTGYDLGVSHDGGYAQYVRVPADWVVSLPNGLSLFEAMALGTAGFTAALAIHLIQKNDITPDSGKVIVTGATGGVASIGIDMLNGLGYEVTALTGKDSEHEYLKQLGAREILSRDRLEMGTKPLEKSLWAAALDSVGGDCLAWLTRTMQQHGVIASFGNAGGIELKTTVMPFILRGVRLVGVDSASTSMPLREKIWQRMATDLRPKHLQIIAQTATFDKLPEVFQKILSAKIRGRVVIKLQ